LACMSRDFDIFMSKHLAGQWQLNSYYYLYSIANSRNYEKDNPRGSQVIAAVAKVSCKHGLWLVARVKKRAHIFVFDMCSLFSLSMLYSIFNFLSASLFATVYLLHGY